MIEVGAVGPKDACEWNRLVKESLHTNFYHLWEWGEVQFSTYRYQRYYLVARQNGNLTGALPLMYVRSRLFGNRLISVPFCGYGGPFVHQTLSDEEKGPVIDKLLSATDRLAASLGVKYVEIRGATSKVAVDILRNPNYTSFQEYVTFRINLTQPVEVLWRNLNKKTRNATRKAMKKGVEVVEAKSVEQLRVYYTLYLKTQKRHGSPPHAFALFKNLFDTFHRGGRMKITLAEYRGKPIAGNMTFYWNKMIYWNSNVTDTAHRHLNPTNLLLWKTIKCGSEDYNKLFDLGRTRPNTTIHHFKKGWGGKETRLLNYMHFSGDVKMPPDPSQGKYVYLSKLWSLIPTSASSRLGPRIISGLAP